MPERALYGVMETRLDDWIDEPAVRSVHRRAAAVEPAALWRAAREVRIADTRTLGRLVSWRIPGVPEGQTFDDLFRGYPFTLLGEGEHWSISGLCGRIWTLARDYPRLAGPEDFAGWEEPGTVRVLFAHWTQPGHDGRAELISEARVEPVDSAAAIRLKALWAVIGPFERLVGAEPLAIAARRAEEES
jgi:hypothetical protein